MPKRIVNYNFHKMLLEELGIPDTDSFKYYGINNKNVASLMRELLRLESIDNE